MHPLSQGVHLKWSWARGQFWVLIQCLRGCHGGRGGKLNNIWFYSLSMKTDFKETLKQKLTVWNIWTFFKQSNLLTSIQIHRRLLRCCFQAWCKMRESVFLKEKLLLWSPCSLLHIFALLSWVVQVSPRQKWWEGKLFKQWAKICPHETRRTFLSCSPSHHTGQKLLADMWPGTCHYTSLVFGLHCTAGTKYCSVSLIFWMSICGSAVLVGDVAVQRWLLAMGVPNRIDIHPAPNRA